MRDNNWGFLKLMCVCVCVGGGGGGGGGTTDPEKCLSTFKEIYNICLVD